MGGAGRPVPGAGAWPRRAARGAGTAGQLASRCGEAGRGPSISYMEGPRLILPGRSVFCQDRHAAAAGTPAAITQVTAESRRAVPGAAAPGPEAVARHRRAANPDPRRRRASAARVLHGLIRAQARSLVSGVLVV